MLINALEIVFEFRHFPEEELRNQYPDAVTKFSYDDSRGNISVRTLNNKEDVFDNPHRVLILKYLPEWFDFKLFRIYLIQYLTNDDKDTNDTKLPESQA